MKRRPAARVQPKHRRYQRLPSSVRFGRGYIVKVVLVTPAQLADILDEEELDPEDRSPGGWDVENFTIWIDGSKPRNVQWSVLFHEQIHALNDIVRLNNLEFPSPERCGR